VTIQSNKTLGGIGACFTIAGVVGTVLSIFQTPISLTPINLGILGVTGVLSILSFVGFVLFFVAMYGFSKDYNERRIFSYILNGLIIAIVLAIVIGVIWFAFTLASILTMISAISPLPSTSPFQTESILTPYYAPLVLTMSAVMVVWIFFNYKAYNLLADKSGVHHFRTAAKIFVAGAAVNIAVGTVFAVLTFYGYIGYTTLLLASVPGGLVMYVAWAFVAKGFFSIQAPPPQPFMQQTVPPTSVQVKYCPSCGAQNRIEAAYCERCGQKLALS
jgi:uncharacterized membrane protein/ribosomal protein L40E